MQRYHWPGDVRHLTNVLERAKILCETETICATDLPREVVSGSAVTHASTPLAMTDDLAAIQRCKVVEVLRREAGNKSRAAVALGIDRRKLYRLLEKYAITEPELSSAAE